MPVQVWGLSTQVGFSPLSAFEAQQSNCSYDSSCPAFFATELTGQLSLAIVKSILALTQSIRKQSLIESCISSRHSAGASLETRISRSPIPLRRWSPKDSAPTASRQDALHSPLKANLSAQRPQHRQPGAMGTGPRLLTRRMEAILAWSLSRSTQPVQ